MNQSVWGPVQQKMSDLLRSQPDDVPAVVDQLTTMQDVLDRVPPLLRDNPIAEVNRLLITVTDGVLERLYAGKFNDPAFISRLDVEFANRYFDALRAWAGAGRSPHCPLAWAGLFRHLCEPGSTPLPAACAGVNAHLNFDLPFALVTTFDHLGTDPIDDSEQHHDYLQINEIFADAVPGLRPGRMDKWQLLIDTMTGCLDDEWWQGEDADYTANVAWRNAQRLWGVRHDLAATERQRAHLDRITADLGRLLLSPRGDFLR